uniref:FYVE-type domain-containing protein n=1 Tax=Hyaloperonospora arabidopsidis (strain Emoy2) TaxID=559515 RepID=M4C639_HYAAE
MLLTGFDHGRVEDAMSAVVTESQHDFALAVKFKHQDVADCAILKTLEPPTQAEPYHYLGFKFFVRKSPTEGHLLKHRHSIYLEYSGLTHSSKGEQLGFHLMHSVELAQFTDLNDYNSIRALQSTRYLYRQKSANLVDVFMLGNMDISGRVFKPLATMFTVDIFFGVTRLLELAEVRRLSQMALKQRTFGKHPALLGASAACHVCSLSGSKRRLMHCQLCGQAVCKKCTIPKRVFQSDAFGILGDFIKVVACQKCVRQANTGTFMSPHERVLHTPVKDSKFTFHQPKPRGEGIPSDSAELKTSKREPGKRRQTFPSESCLAPDPARNGGLSLPVTSLLSQLDEEELDIPDSFLENRQRTMKEERHSDQRDHRANDEASKPPVRMRASNPSQADGRFVYNLLPPKVQQQPSGKTFEVPTNVSAGQRSMMTRLFELSKIAEDTSATARLNGIYCEQYWRNELELEVETGRSQARRTQC